MMKQVGLASILLVMLVASVSAQGYGKAASHSSKSHHSKTVQRSCERVPYYETVTEMETAIEVEDYDCSKTVVTQECEDVTEVVPRTCFENVKKVEEYECSETVQDVQCDTFGKKLRLLGKRKHDHYPAAASKKSVDPRCHPVPRKVTKTCQRFVPSQEPYSCDQASTRLQCTDVERYVAETCQRQVEVQKPRSYEVRKFREECHDNRSK